MKRDMDLIRKLLLAIEENPETGGIDSRSLNLEGYAVEAIYYHLCLLTEAGFIEANPHPRAPVCVIKRLTWEGHEFLEKSRNESNWERAKKQVFEKTGSLSFEAIKIALTELIKMAMT